MLQLAEFVKSFLKTFPGAYRQQKWVKAAIGHVDCFITFSATGREKIICQYSHIINKKYDKLMACNNAKITNLVSDKHPERRVVLSVLHLESPKFFWFKLHFSIPAQCKVWKLRSWFSFLQFKIFNVDYTTSILYCNI